ncbi:MAG: hypothetical protein JXX14_07830 [Deltaproteobacteria bacterium]|nr:hypothetical protein [Deltaproteobacteria bacterium]
MTKIIGTTTTYKGSEFGFMKNLKVRIVAILRSDVDPDSEDAFVKDDQHLARLGGVKPNDRIEVQPWIEKEGRFSWVTSDPKATDLACFKQLAQNK